MEVNGKLRNMTSLYIMREDRILLLYRIGSKAGEPSWRGIGGHFEKEELNDAKACILREMSEETGIFEKDLKTISLRYVTIRLINDEIRQNYYFFAELKNDVELISECCGVMTGKEGVIFANLS